jgi:hypothetical protein
MGGEPLMLRRTRTKLQHRSSVSALLSAISELLQVSFDLQIWIFFKLFASLDA